MARLSVAVPHALGEEEAARRLKARFDAVKARHAGDIQALEEQWEGSTLRARFQAMGLKFAGTVTAGPSIVAVDADLPLAAALFKGAIETRVRDELGKLLEQGPVRE